MDLGTRYVHDFFPSMFSSFRVLSFAVPNAQQLMEEQRVKDATALAEQLSLEAPGSVDRGVAATESKARRLVRIKRTAAIVLIHHVLTE